MSLLRDDSYTNDEAGAAAWEWSHTPEYDDDTPTLAELLSEEEWCQKAIAQKENDS